MAAQPYKNRSDYRYFHSINTRWADNDIYGHINNVNYYSYFDTTVNCYLIDKGGLDIHSGAIVGFVVHSSCDYIKPISFPVIIEVGLKVKKIGNSSVHYELGIFKEGSMEIVAKGAFIHVFVNKKENKSVPIPEKIRVALEHLLT